MHVVRRVAALPLSRNLAASSQISPHAPQSPPPRHAACAPCLSTARAYHSVPMNTVIMFVPQQEAWVVERMGKYNRILEPGFNLLVPLIDRVKYVQSLKEQTIEVPQQSAITSDNVTLSIDGVLYLRVMNPYRASYGVEDPEFAITQLAQTTMRSELGKIQLDKVFMERENLNIAIVESINKASESWGIQCMRYEIRDIKLPLNVQEAMQMQAQAERRKRASVLESEGTRISEVNVATGHKEAVILASEAAQREAANRASGEAEAMLSIARARASALQTVAEALQQPAGREAAALSVAEQYVRAFAGLAKQGNTLLLPADAANPAAMVAHAMAVYGTLGKNGANVDGSTGADLAPKVSVDSSPDK